MQKLCTQASLLAQAKLRHSNTEHQWTPFPNSSEKRKMNHKQSLSFPGEDLLPMSE